MRPPPPSTHSHRDKQIVCFSERVVRVAINIPAHSSVFTFERCGGGDAVTGAHPCFHDHRAAAGADPAARCPAREAMEADNRTLTDDGGDG